MLCRFSFPKIAVLAARLPGLQRQLFRLLSRDIGRAELLAADWSADQRMAAFLMGLSHRLQSRGFSAPEKVSRVLRAPLRLEFVLGPTGVPYDREYGTR